MKIREVELGNYSDFDQEGIKKDARIEELEDELAKFQECSGFEVFTDEDGECGLRMLECHNGAQHYHKDGQ